MGVYVLLAEADADARVDELQYLPERAAIPVE